MSKECPKLPVMYNMSVVKMSNSWTMNEAHEKEFDISRLKYMRPILRSHLKVLQITQQHNLFYEYFQMF